jgi:endonuclease/exonuclease/phosphatase family metal-dependent hydrolase
VVNRRAVRLSLLFATALCGTAFFAAPAAEGAFRMKAMSRNLYLGTDLVPVAAAQNKADLEQRVDAAFDQVGANRPARRMALIAREIARHDPDVVGLQEAGIWRTGTKDSPSPARRVVYNYLRLLQRALRRLGLDYRLGRVEQELDIEGPSAGGVDVRFTQQDALLVRRRPGLRILRLRSGNFDAQFNFPSAVMGNIPILRGWTLADLAFRGTRFRFVNMHTEAYNDDVRIAQTRELYLRGGPARTSRSVILVGDLNSDPAGRGGQGEGAYNAITEDGGFVDTWTAANPGRAGFTFGVDAALENPDFDRRIDFVFEKGRFRTRRSQVFGGAPVGGQWPSDHKGVLTTLVHP